MSTEVVDMWLALIADTILAQITNEQQSALTPVDSSEGLPGETA
jgi:hypothetical protein